MRPGSRAPLLIALVALALAAAASFAGILQATGGGFAYVLDDPYIHMAIARNASEHGVWGVTRHGFTSSSSSPLWTLLLAGAYGLAGPRLLLPLAFNLLWGALLLWQLHRMLVAAGTGGGFRLAALLAALLVTPLPALAFGGQEHLLHALLTLMFADAAVRWLDTGDATAGDAGPAGGVPLGLLLLAPLLTATRYEGVGLLVAVAAMIAARRRPVAALLVAAAGAVPPLLAGLVSASKGWGFLPSPVLLKGHLPGISRTSGGPLMFASDAARRLLEAPRALLVLLIVASVLLALRLFVQGRPSSRGATLCTIFVAAVLLHAGFGEFGWFYRYEAYLVALGVAAIAVCLARGERGAPPISPVRGPGFAPAAAALGLVALIACLPPAARAARSLAEIPRAARNIHDQQVQMGLFLRTYYEGRSVALNDIGAVNFIADIRCLDLWGLASREAARARLDGTWSTGTIARLAEDKECAIAIVYDRWFEGIGGLPRSWVRVGEWTIRDLLVSGGDTVSFYAVAPEEAPRLALCLREFAPRLPAGVTYRDLAGEAD